MCLLNYAPNHEDAWGNNGIAKLFLTSALDGHEWSASRLGALPPVPIRYEARWA
jgi:hypothetical protein